MSRTMHLVFGLAACVLLQATAASAKDQVERPFRGEATATWLVSMLDGSSIGYQEGVGTHVGRFTAEAIAVWNLDPENFGIVSASGVSTAANGDLTFWVMTPDQPGVVQITGGTGRFENATGSFVAVLPYEAFDVSVDLETLTMTITVTYKAVGTLTY